MQNDFNDFMGFNFVFGKPKEKRKGTEMRHETGAGVETIANRPGDSAIRLSQKLLRSISSQTSDKSNLLFSPLSIEIVLALLGYAAEGKTRQELISYLGDDSDDLLNEISALAASVADDRAAFVANAIFADDLVIKNLLPPFIATIRKTSATEILPLPDNPKEINDWVRLKTKRMIPSIVSPGERLENLNILNAVAFEASWLDPYYDEYVKDGFFYRQDGSMEKAKFLLGTEERLINNESAIGFLKPYQNCGFSFMALLPKETKSPADYIASLPENALSEMIRGAVGERVIVTMPEFSFDDMHDIKQILQIEGVRSVFEEKTADISNMVSLTGSYVANIKHKAHIEVDRKGTKAAATTMISCCAAGIPPKPRFNIKLDRPFVFAIVHDESGLPLFLGVVNTLKKTE